MHPDLLPFPRPPEAQRLHMEALRVVARGGEVHVEMEVRERLEVHTMRFRAAGRLDTFLRDLMAARAEAWPDERPTKGA
jgi:hypothetical protein